MDKKFLKEAINLSQKSVEDNGFPVGAVLVIENMIISEGLSNGKNLNDATSHAETEAIREASKQLGQRDLHGAVLYSSMEPCLMCFSACYWAKIAKIVYAIPKRMLPKMHYDGLHDLKAINNINNRQMEILKIDELENAAIKVVNGWAKQRVK
jgi:tRNA(Arg) A34 adenosine deaminase TadA